MSMNHSTIGVLQIAKKQTRMAVCITGVKLRNSRKILVRDAYMRQLRMFTTRPNILDAAVKCDVSRSYVLKIETELFGNGFELSSVINKPTGKNDPGHRVLDRYGHHWIIFLYLLEPSQPVKSYCDHFLILTGKRISANTMTGVLKKAHPFRGNLRCMNVVPLDKFRPDNLIKAVEVVDIISNFLLKKSNVTMKNTSK
uniref:Uncharacterized protein n=1 Tax=Corethron hystrix TaxID=216773 RepID=A0A7S1FN15_9STRA|mmetsp:Transcript_173/g.375  ORF Transcript_173/g.375 Transcript_173/m.375 type:complete len:198 (+) Transcript_173:40-633(+)